MKQKRIKPISERKAAALRKQAKRLDLDRLLKRFEKLEQGGDISGFNQFFLDCGEVIRTRDSWSARLTR